MCLFVSHSKNNECYHPRFLHTGKTVVLVLTALRWLLQGNSVHVVSTDPTTLAASLMIQRQLEESLTADPTALTPGTVILHRYDILTREADVAVCVRELLTAARQAGRLHVIMDEAEFGDR